MKLKFWNNTDSTDTAEVVTKAKYIRASNGGIFNSIILMGLAVVYDNTGAWLKFNYPVLGKVILFDLVAAALMIAAFFFYKKELHISKAGKFNPPAALSMIFMAAAGCWTLYNQFSQESTQHEAILVAMIAVFIAHWTQLYRFIMEVVDNPDPVDDDAEPVHQDEPTQAAA